MSHLCYNTFRQLMCRFLRQGGGAMRTYEVLSLMIAFGILVATIILATK